MMPADLGHRVEGWHPQARLASEARSTVCNRAIKLIHLRELRVANCASGLPAGVLLENP